MSAVTNSYALYYYHLPYYHLPPAWKQSEDLVAPSGLHPWGWLGWAWLRRWLSLNLKVTCWQAGGRPSWSRRQWRPSCAYKALHILPAMLCAAPDVCRAAWWPLSSSHSAALGLAVSWLQRSFGDYFGWVKHFPSLKQIWSWIRNTSVNSFPRIQPWFHDILHSTEFTHEFMIMNLYHDMISLLWIHQHEF